MPAAIAPLAVSHFTVITALGSGREAHAQAVRDGRAGLRVNDFSHTPLDCWIGRVDGLEQAPLPEQWSRWNSRNNRLAWRGLCTDGFAEQVRAAAERYGPSRVAVLLGTSTGSIGATEAGYRDLRDGHLPPAAQRPHIHSLHSLGGFVAEAFDLHGPCLTVSTACSSSAKVFAMAERLLRLDLVDAALVGGVDSLCESVLFGFNALELVSKQPCRPFDVARDGLSIGEAAAFALLERIDAAPKAPRLIGYGESSDAHHMSAPHPQGLGAQLALDDALARAGLEAAQVDYINLHGTATRMNDAVEAALVARRFTPRTRVSSTKGATGHTLGAAGAVEATLTLLGMAQDRVPANLGCAQAEPALAAYLARTPETRSVRVALSNSFGFGGNNACLVLAAGSAP